MNIVELETKKSTYRVCIGDDDELEMLLDIIYDNEKYDTFIRIENVLTGVFPMIKFKERCDTNVNCTKGKKEESNLSR